MFGWSRKEKQEARTYQAFVAIYAQLVMLEESTPEGALNTDSSSDDLIREAWHTARVAEKRFRSLQANEEKERAEYFAG